MIWKSIVLVFVANLSNLPTGNLKAESKSPDLPPGFEQILKRGALASIDSPVYVSANEAEMPADAWVLGVLIEGEARAYSLNLLISHEVVNDEIAGQPVAAVW
jgi:hypothetical protein